MTAAPDNSPQAWVADLKFERLGLLRRALKAAVVNPFANYFPSSMQRLIFRLMRSELAAANWTDPGGWRSMVISYDGQPRRLADRVLVLLGTIPMALRNRRRLAARVLARLIETADHEPVEVLCLGAGAGHAITDALRETRRHAHATFVDFQREAFDHGHGLAKADGTHEQLRFIEGDVREVRRMLDRPPDIVKMLGICEYLSDDHLADIIRAVAEVMPPGSTIVFNSLSAAHGTDRFFRRVLGLDMIHRTPEQLQALMRPAGFGDFVALPEPLGVYHVILGRKV
jgi:hypothetical protein